MSTSPPMTVSSAIGIVAVVSRREILARLRDRTFLISTGLLLVIVAASVSVPLLLDRDTGTPRYTLAVLGAEGVAVGELAVSLSDQALAVDGESRGQPSAPAVHLTLRAVTDLPEAEFVVREKSVDAALVADAQGRLTVVGAAGVAPDLSRLISLASQLRRTSATLFLMGADPEVARQLVDVAPPPSA